MAQKEHEQTLKQIEDLKPKVEEASAKLADAKRGREGGEDGGESRAKKLARLAELTKKKSEYEKELESLKENDSAVIARLSA